MRHLQLLQGGLSTPKEELDASEEGLARRLGLARELAGLTLNQVAPRLQASPAWVGQVERGRARLALDDVAKFARLYACSEDWLLGLVPELADPSEIPVHNRRQSNLSPEEWRQIRLIFAMCKTSPENDPAPTAFGAERRLDA